MKTDSLIQKFKVTRPGDLAVFGDPIEHSLSPVMHNAAIATWTKALQDQDIPVPQYHKFLVHSEDLPLAFELLKKHKFRGVNITLPHKIAACQFMDNLDAFAQKSEAVNTVVNHEGRLEGHNTDGYGFHRAIEMDLGFEAEGTDVLVLGAGGTGRVIVLELQEAGCKTIYWWNRHPKKLHDLMKLAGRDFSSVRVLETEKEVVEIAPRANLIINATSVGLKSGDGLPVNYLEFSKGQYVFDVVYHRETEFLSKARLQGSTVAGGLGMLVYQGAQSFRLWMGKPAPVEVMRLTLSEALKKV